MGPTGHDPLPTCTEPPAPGPPRLMRAWTTWGPEALGQQCPQTPPHAPGLEAGARGPLSWGRAEGQQDGTGAVRARSQACTPPAGPPACLPADPGKEGVGRRTQV